jgi:hypothetical protein
LFSHPVLTETEQLIETLPNLLCPAERRIIEFQKLVNISRMFDLYNGRLADLVIELEQ